MGSQVGKPTKPFSTLYLRLFIPISIALLLAAGAAWWIGTTVLYNTLESRLLTQLNHAVESVSQRSFPLTEPVLARLGKLLDASIYVFDTEGELQFQGPLDQPKLLESVAGHYRVWQGGNTAEGEIYFAVDQRDYLMVLREHNSGWQPGHQTVVAVADLSDVREATRMGAKWLAGLAACGISLLAFIGHRIARSITVPVSELATMAGNIAAGDREVRADVHRLDEVGVLAQSLNSMADRLTMYEQKVAEQSRLLTLGELSAKVAHEIRNPLTAIKMQLQLHEDESPETAKPRLAALISEVRRLELIVATTLQMGRPDTLERQSLDLNSLVVDVLTLLQPQLEHRRIATTTRLAENLPTCWLDANRVKQILLNLINNAADELLRGGEIVVGTRLVEDGRIALEVEDSGPGIPLERRATLFDKATSDKPSGFGLGLRVTRELVELHGGIIEVADSEMGGALFRVLFPREN